MPSSIIRKLRTMNTWYLVGLSVISSETITALLSIALMLIGWGKISFDVLLVGAIDVFVATAIVAPLLIRLIKQTATLEELNAGFAFEIAERKRMSDALEQQRAFLRQVIDTDPNFIFVRDRAGYYWLANKAFADMLGVSSAEIVGKALSDFWGDPAKAARFNQEDIAVMDSLKELYIPEEQIEIGGQIRWFRFVKRPIVNREGVANQVLCVFADITERKQIEQALRVSEERWRMYIEQANDLIFALDGSGKITLANRAVCRTLGYAVDEIIGASPLDFVAPEKRAAVDAALARILSGGDVDQMEMDALTKDGRLITIEVRGRILLEQGKFAGTFHIARDITERKRIEEQLRYLSAHDVLTGLYNRAHFEAAMTRLAHGRQFPVSIVMVDVNGLKE
ncbi:partial putative diguanylate cyclase DgcE, partial [Anaerolineae bacterium]